MFHNRSFPVGAEFGIIRANQVSLPRKKTSSMVDHPDPDFDDNDYPRRSGPWRLILIVAVVTLVAVLLVPSEPQQEPQTATGAPDDTAGAAPSLLDEAASLPPPPPRQKTVTTPVPPPRAERPGAAARNLIARLRASDSVDLDQVTQTAWDMQARGERTDAYLLFFYAAREGNPGAAFALGEQADPNFWDAATSVYESSDLAQSYKWYSLAAKGGDASAQQRIQILRTQIEQRAATGDTEARRLMLLWQ
jgi:TPR repeat protein